MAEAAPADASATDDPDAKRSRTPAATALDTCEPENFSAPDADQLDAADEQPLGHRVRLARTSAGLSKSELARRVGVCLSAAVQWELANGTSPTVANLVRIARVTEVSFEWLATGRGSPILPDELLEADASGASIEYEKRLLKAARDVPDARRELVIEFALAIVDSE
jgi:transcriptional regulator with XRE-family HTH domain